MDSDFNFQQTYVRSLPQNPPEYNKRYRLQNQLSALIAQLSQDEQVNYIFSLVPDFRLYMDRLKSTTLKFTTLIDRLKNQDDKDLVFQQVQIKIRQQILADPQLKRLGITDDITTHSKQVAAAHIRQKILQKQTSLVIDSLINKEQKLLEERRNQIKDHTEHINQTQLRLRDTQIQRLQDKLKEHIAKERAINESCEKITDRQTLALNKLSSCLCFGKVLFVLVPVCEIAI